MKKASLLFIPFLLIMIVCPIFGAIGQAWSTGSNFVSADTINDVDQELQDAVNEGLDDIDMSGFDDIIAGLDAEGQSMFGGQSFWEKVTKLLSGDFGSEYTNYFQGILDLLFGDILNFLPLLCTIVAVTVLCGLISNLKGSVGNESVGRIIEFVCFGVVVVIISASVMGLLNLAGSAIGSLKAQMDILFPILLTLLAGVGGVVSVGIFQPAVVILSNVVVNIFSVIVVPLFVFSFVFIVVGNLTGNTKLNKFVSLFSSIFKWIVGVSFSLFLTMLVVQGIVAGSIDSMSIRATKFAIKSYIPILGGYLSDGFNLIMASSVLIKNAVGMVGLLLMLATIAAPVIKIAVFGLGLKLTAAILEPMSPGRVPDFLHQVSKILNFLIAICVGVGFMYLITVGLILCTANLG